MAVRHMQCCMRPVIFRNVLFIGAGTRNVDDSSVSCFANPFHRGVERESEHTGKQILENTTIESGYGESDSALI